MTTPLSLEQRILIAAEYNADRVEAIKKLMEEEAINYFKWLHETFNHPYEGLPISGNTTLGGMTIYVNGTEYPISHSYQLYLQQKNKLNNG